jgi:hypothetical protein
LNRSVTGCIFRGYGFASDVNINTIDSCYAREILRMNSLGLNPFLPALPHLVRLSLGFLFLHGRMVRGDHGLPKFSPWPAKPYPSTPCSRATFETALQPFERCLAWRASRGRVLPVWTPHAPAPASSSIQIFSL